MFTAIWQTVVTILKYGPSLFTLVNEIMKLIKNLMPKDPETAKVAKKILDEKVQAYKATGNMQPLRDLRDGLHEQCFGPSCSRKKGADNGV